MGFAFGVFHWFTYHDLKKTILVALFGGIFLNWLYAMFLPWGLPKIGLVVTWNFIIVIAIHFAARIAGRYIRL